MGLGIMRERAEAVGAQLGIASQAGQGTRLTMVWPGDAEEQNNGPSTAC
jgi:signal transduction histidine kinase